jgi:hypothetical protein
MDCHETSMGKIYLYFNSNLTYNNYTMTTMNDQSLIFRLRKRAEIRRRIASRKSVQEGKPDRIADLLEEAAQALEDVVLKEIK